MNNEESFYKELSIAPELPSGAYSGICKKIARNTILKRSTVVLIISAICSLTFFRLNSVTHVSQKTIEPVIASELQIIQDYLNGTDISEYNDSYAYLYVE